MYQGEKKSKFSSKYALTGKVICGECGAKYRRVTRSKNGKKTIVWRCIERLTNGPIKCKNSPTILEEDLHKAILDSVKKILGNPDFLKDKVRDEIEAVLCKNDEYNSKVIKRKIRNYEKEIHTLRSILRETEDKEFYLEKIKFLENSVAELHRIRESTSNKKVIIQSGRLGDDSCRDMTTYLSELVRNAIKCVVVDNKEFKIEFLVYGE